MPAPTSDKILMRKIKKREKIKQKFLKSLAGDAAKNVSDIIASTTEVLKGPPDNENSVKPKHKLKKKNKMKEEPVEIKGEGSSDIVESDLITTELELKEKEIKDDTSNENEYTSASTAEVLKGSPDNENRVKLKHKLKKRNKIIEEPDEIKGEESSDIVESDLITTELELKKKEIKDETGDENEFPQSVLKLDMSSKKFSVFEGVLSDSTMKSIQEMGFTTMTEIQARTIPYLMNGSHMVATARNGAGKTLAFLIPIIEVVIFLGYKRRNGTAAIILCPTRELAIQTYGVLVELMKYHRHSYGLVIGGADKKKEERMLYNGVNILVATPGRLLDHLQNTPDFMYKNMYCLVIDEFDRILDIGFEEEVNQIIKLLPKDRQRVFFSATQTKKTEALIKALPINPMYVNVEQATSASLIQGFFLCEPDKRMLVLFTLLKGFRNKKAIVFFSTCKSVEYHYKLFNYIGVPVMSIHGKQDQAKRTTTFFQFSNAESGILLCTDVAARGLDIPAVDWVLQYDPPDDPKEYIQRVGRTARGLGTKGTALIFLLSEEMGFLYYLKEFKIRLDRWTYDKNHVMDIQESLETLIATNYKLREYATEAFKSYIRSYESHHMKSVFDINKLDVAKIAKSFGFPVPPNVEYSGTNKGPSRKRKINNKTEGNKKHKQKTDK